MAAAMVAPAVRPTCGHASASGAPFRTSRSQMPVAVRRGSHRAVTSHNSRVGMAVKGIVVLLRPSWSSP